MCDSIVDVLNGLVTCTLALVEVQVYVHARCPVAPGARLLTASKRVDALGVSSRGQLQEPLAHVAIRLYGCVDMLS